MTATLAPATAPRTNWAMFTADEQAAIARHHRQIRWLARYAVAVGKVDVRVIGDDSEEEPGWGFRAVEFTHNGQRVVVRTGFELQHRYM